MPEDSHGILTGFYSLSRGLGVMLGPLLAGVAIQVLRGPFSSTHGFAAMWIVTSASILASVPVLSGLRRRVAASQDR
jgi:MFS-type transporter involved in bile tolerance (Atg22 family)